MDMEQIWIDKIDRKVYQHDTFLIIDIIDRIVYQHDMFLVIDRIDRIVHQYDIFLVIGRICRMSRMDKRQPIITMDFYRNCSMACIYPYLSWYDEQRDGIEMKQIDMDRQNKRQTKRYNRYGQIKEEIDYEIEQLWIEIEYEYIEQIDNRGNRYIDTRERIVYHHHVFL